MPLLNTRAPIMGGKCEAGELASNDGGFVTGKRDNEHVAIYMSIKGGKMMSKFIDIELEYLKAQRLVRLATVNKNGEPQIAPVTFRYDAELDTIDIGGLNMGESQKFRNVARNGLASFVIDDVLPPFQPRGVEIRGRAEALPDGGQRISPNFSPALIRLTPGRIISWNLTIGDPAQTHSARNV